MSVIGFVIVTFLVAQGLEPEIVGGELQRLGASTDLRRDVELVGGNGWVGYAVPAVSGKGHGCGGVYDLEHGGGYTSSRDVSETDRWVFVFYRLRDGMVDAVRAVTAGCRIHAGDARVSFWSGVSPVESVSFLDAIARDDPSSELAEEALHAIARHAHEAADRSVEAFATGSWPRELREKAVFWLGAARGEAGYRVLARLIDDEREADVLEKVVFALHVSDASGATETLVRAARAHPDPDVREKSLFWLAQEAGKRAAEAIAEAVRDDPELDVKKKAVFALSQLPADEGIPLLVEVAQTHPQPEIRKKAFFWLGQSRDPRALALIESVLLNR